MDVNKVAKKLVSLTIIRRHHKMKYSTMFEDVIHQDQEYTSQISRQVLKPYSAIPGPRELPLIGNAWRFAPLIGQYKIQELDKAMWSLHREYGEIVKVGGLVGHPDLLFIFNADDIENVFRKEEVMPYRPSMPSLHYYKQELQREFFQGNAGVIGIHGPEWEVFRKKVQQFLLPPHVAKSYIEPLDDIAGDFIDRMSTLRDENSELPGNFLFEIYKWALESVARVSLNTRLGCLDQNLPADSESQKIINSINTFFWNVAEVELKMPVWRLYHNKAFKKYITALEDFRTLCLKHISNSMEQLKNRKESHQFNERSILENILLKSGQPKLAAVLALDLLLVGVDTTSIALASTIYQLAKNPDKQAKLLAELQSVLPHSDAKYDLNVHENIPYLKACIKEALRMYPVIIGNGRNLQSDTVINGYEVPKGTHIIFPHLVVSHDEKYFENPQQFVPERWLKSECPHKSDKIHPFASLPFGYGRRSCLGRRFAELELQILLSKIFRKFSVEYNHGPIKYKITPTYAPENLKFKLVERTNIYVKTSSKQ